MSERKEVINEHGFPQLIDDDGNPICCQCGGCVMPNKGQGTMCDKCGHEFDMECEHDRDML